MNDEKIIKWLRSQLEKQEREYKSEIAALKEAYERQIEEIKHQSEMSKLPKFVTAKDAMAALGISKSLWYSRIRPLLTEYRIAGMTSRYRVDDLEYITDKINKYRYGK